MNYEISLKNKCNALRRDLRRCLSQLESIEKYFSQDQAGELRLHGRNGFLTFLNGEYIGHTQYIDL